MAPSAYFCGYASEALPDRTGSRLVKTAATSRSTDSEVLSITTLIVTNVRRGCGADAL